MPARTYIPTMDSSYLTAALKVVRQAFPGATIRKEQNLYQLTKGTVFSPDLMRTIKDAGADLKRMRVDLYVKGQVAFEIHGEQHAKPVRFSNEILDPQEELTKRITFDTIKSRALAEAGIPLVTLWFEELNEGLKLSELQMKICLAQSIASKIPKQRRADVKTAKFRTQKEAFKARAARLAKARDLRRKAYRRAKAIRKSWLPDELDKMTKDPKRQASIRKVNKLARRLDDSTI